MNGKIQNFKKIVNYKESIEFVEFFKKFEINNEMGGSTAD